MSEIMEVAHQRQISDVTRDIRIQTGQFLRTAIEIGRLLFEAKAMVEPGGWSRYIEEEMPFSHSWANNYMKLYKEYGSDQTSLFGDSQTFMNLRPTQALELLALPAGEREAFVQENDVADMSTRQLRQAIKDLEDTRRELQEAEKDRDKAEEGRLALESELMAARGDIEGAREATQKAEKEKSRAEKSEQNALNLVEKMKKQLADAQKKEQQAREDLKKARENPDIPESMMEQLRREAEADAASKAAAEAQKQLAAAKEELQAAISAREAAESAARDVQDKLVAAQKSEKLSNPDVMSINVLGQQLLSLWNTIQGHKKKAVAADPANAKPIDGFLQKVLDTMRDTCGG